MKGPRVGLCATYGVAFAALLLTNGRLAHAGPSSKSVAQMLFDEGRRLMASGKVSAGCEKFGESYRVDKTLGTLLNLAVCHEKDGRLATARAEFEELEATATHDQQATRAQFARDRLAAIEPKVNKLLISIRATDASTRVTIDGSDLPSAAWGVAAPVDPGKHAIEVTASGKTTWSHEVEVTGEGRSVLVDIPALLDDALPAQATAAPAVVAPERVHAEPARGGPSVLSLGLVGGGLVALGVGGIFGAKAAAAQAEARGRCERGGCDEQATRLLDEKSTSALVATIGVTAGVVALGAGVYFLVRGGRAQPVPPVGRAPGLGIGISGSYVGGVF